MLLFGGKITLPTHNHLAIGRLFTPVDHVQEDGLPTTGRTNNGSKTGGPRPKESAVAQEAPTRLRLDKTEGGSVYACLGVPKKQLRPNHHCGASNIDVVIPGDFGFTARPQGLSVDEHIVPSAKVTQKDAFFSLDKKRNTGASRLYHDVAPGTTYVTYDLGDRIAHVSVPHSFTLALRHLPHNSMNCKSSLTPNFMQGYEICGQLPDGIP
jgi:hypothetical protein